MQLIKKILLALFVSLGALGLTPEVSAQLSPYNTILRVSVAPHPNIDPISEPIATLGLAKDGSMALIVRVFSKVNGMQQGSALVLPLSSHIVAKDVLLSTIFMPGSVLVLDSTRRVHVFPLGFRSDLTPFVLAGATVLGPIGPAGAGAGTVFGEAPNPANTSDPFLAVGTLNGEVIIATHTINSIIGVTDGEFGAVGPIQDLGPLAQVGYFAIGAVSGGVLYGIHPDADARLAGLQPAVRFSVRDTRTKPLIDFASLILFRTSPVLTDPLPVRIATANATTEIATLEIAASPTIGGVLTVKIIETVSTPIIQTITYSLTALPADGSGIIYNKNFTFEDGIVGRLWTIAGATMVLDAETLSPRGPSRWLRARIEAENQRAAEIDLATLTLSVDGARGAMPGGPRPAALLADFDGDTNVDLEVPFQSAVLNGLLRQVPGHAVTVRASWRYQDGTEGTASAEVTVVR